MRVQVVVHRARGGPSTGVDARQRGASCSDRREPKAIHQILEMLAIRVLGPEFLEVFLDVSQELCLMAVCGLVARLLKILPRL